LELGLQYTIRLVQMVEFWKEEMMNSELYNIGSQGA